jgi:hypothetical protein
MKTGGLGLDEGGGCRGMMGRGEGGRGGGVILLRSRLVFLILLTFLK